MGSTPITASAGQAIVTSADNRFFSMGTPNWVYAPNPAGANGSHTYTVDGDTGPGIDCSNLVYQSLLAAGYNVTYATAQSSNNSFTNIVNGTQSSSQFDVISASQVQAGDVVVFNGHVGIVESYTYDPATGTYTGTFEASSKLWCCQCFFWWSK